MDLGLAGKVALVTGGSRGIGHAIARELAREGAAVAICGRDETTSKAAAEKLSKETGGRVIGFRADTGVGADVQALVAGTVKELGGLDVLVNNAARMGATGGSPDNLAQMDEELLLSDFNVKVMGYLRCAREATPHMEAKGWGRIVNIDGMATRNAAGISGGIRNAAVMNATKVMSEELGPKGITVNAVHPAVTRTEGLIIRLEAISKRQGISIEQAEKDLAAGNAIRRIVDAEDIANVVAFLCSEQAGCITGEAIGAHGGSTKAVYY